MDKVKEETAKDEVLLSLRSDITQVWPNTRSDCPAHLYAFWNYCDKWTVGDGLILKGTCVLISKSLRAITTAITLRTPRSGKCKLRGKGWVFWANINCDIEVMVKSCTPCQHNQHMNLKKPLIPHDIHRSHGIHSDVTYSFGATCPIYCYLTITAISPGAKTKQHLVEDDNSTAEISILGAWDPK